MKEIAILISEIKKGKKDSFLVIIDRFSPLIKKYVKLLYRNDGEDVYAEMILALWEAVHNIRYYDDEGQVVNYIYAVLRNKFNLLYRKSKYEHEYLTQINIDTRYEKMYLDKRQNVIEFEYDLESFLSNYQKKRKYIYIMMLKYSCSDTQVAKRVGVSRQYINRLRRELRRDIKIKYIDSLYESVI